MSSAVAMDPNPFEAIYQASRAAGLRAREYVADGGKCPRKRPAAAVHGTASGMLPSAPLKKEIFFFLQEKWSLAEEVVAEEDVLRHAKELKPGWLTRFVVQKCPHLKDNAKERKKVVKRLSKWKAKFRNGELDAPETPGPALAGAGRSGYAVSHTRFARRKRKFTARSKALCQVLREELFDWFVNWTATTRARTGSGVILTQAQILKMHLIKYYDDLVESGEIEQSQVPRFPCLAPPSGWSWLQRWRREYGITWRTVNLRFKCSKAVLQQRLKIFWSNVLIVRWLHFYLHVHPPGGDPFVEADGEPRLFFDNSDQKPLWFNTAAMERTLALRGDPRVTVKELLSATRERYTAMTRVRWPSPPDDGKDLAVLFKAATGEQLRPELERHLPSTCMLQFGPKGSYRLSHTLEYYSWIVPHRGHPVAPARPGDKCPRRSQDIVVFLADWFAPNLDDELQMLIHERGHCLLLFPGLVTGQVQVNDTHAHAPFSKIYKALETRANQEELALGKPMQDMSRRTMLERACNAWSQVNQQTCTHGFVSNGIANALDGHEDDLISDDCKPFWEANSMPEVRERIRVFIKGKVRNGEATHMHDYLNYLYTNPACKYAAEGHECFKAFEAGPDDEDVVGPAGEDKGDVMAEWDALHDESGSCPPALWAMMSHVPVASAPSVPPPGPLLAPPTTTDPLTTSSDGSCLAPPAPVTPHTLPPASPPLSALLSPPPLPPPLDSPEHCTTITPLAPMALEAALAATDPTASGFCPGVVDPEWTVPPEVASASLAVSQAADAQLSVERALHALKESPSPDVLARQALERRLAKLKRVNWRAHDAAAVDLRSFSIYQSALTERARMELASERAKADAAKVELALSNAQLKIAKASGKK